MEKDTQGLTIQSFERNQNLLEQINNLIIYLKLSLTGTPSGISSEEIFRAKKDIQVFFEKINALVKDVDSEISLKGADMRLRSLVRDYVEAKHRNRLTRSVLFKQNPDRILEWLNSEDNTDKSSLIQALSELRTLLEGHIDADSKQLISNF